MFDSKFNLTAIKILLVFIIVAFFTPFFFVSCGENDSGANFSGFEMSTGKYVGGYWQQGNPFGFALVFLPAALLILSFFAAGNAKIHALCRYLFFIAPIFDIFAAFVARYAFLMAASGKFGEIPVTIGTRPGFALYVVSNAALFALGTANYFKKN